MVRVQASKEKNIQSPSYRNTLLWNVFKWWLLIWFLNLTWTGVRSGPIFLKNLQSTSNSPLKWNHLVVNYCNRKWVYTEFFLLAAARNPRVAIQVKFIAPLIPLVPFIGCVWERVTCVYIWLYKFWLKSSFYGNSNESLFSSIYLWYCSQFVKGGSNCWVCG